ncbi:MAG: hypothetical protein ACTHN8_13465 [Angustibacter sp.]
MPMDPPLPACFDRSHAFAAGLTRHQIAQRVRSGRWHALSRDHYAVATAFDGLSDRDQHVLRLVALLDRRGPTDVASHLSGVVVHGWGLPFDGPGSPTVTSGDLRRSARRRPELVVQVATLPERDVVRREVMADGQWWSLRATTPARTLADVLRHVSPADSVAIADGALRAGEVHREAVRRVLDRQEPWPYLARGRGALELLDARRESYLESYSFVRLLDHGLPMPEPQVSLYTREGEFVARVDGWLDQHAVALEADGAAKYLLGAGGVASPSPAYVVREVERSLRDQYDREGRLAELGVTVVRWTTAEILASPGRVAARVRAACARGRAARFRGIAVPAEPHPSCI